MIFGGVITTFPKLISSIDLKNDIPQLSVTDIIESTVDYATGLVGPTTSNQQCETIMEERVTIE